MFGPGGAVWQVQKTLHPASLASTEKFKQFRAEPGEMGRPAAESPSRLKSIITVSVETMEIVNALPALKERTISKP